MKVLSKIRLNANQIKLIAIIAMTIDLVLCRGGLSLYT